MAADEMKLLIYDYLFGFVVSSFEFVDGYFSFFGEENIDLLFWEFGEFDETVSVLSDC